MITCACICLRRRGEHVKIDVMWKHCTNLSRLCDNCRGLGREVLKLVLANRLKRKNFHEQIAFWEWGKFFNSKSVMLGMMQFQAKNARHKL